MMPGDLRHDLRCRFGLSVLIVLQLAAAALPAEKSRGIAPADLNHFQTDPIWCKDKSKSFPLSRLNDDYCDCPDGTDEPGTSACPEGRFFCKNSGHAPLVLFSSRVNDGICDCCDGSDEFSGKVKCVDTCWEAGKKSREKLEKKVAVFKEGARLRAKYIQDSKQARKDEETELAALKKEEKSLKDITQKLKVQLEAVEEAERIEREKKAKEDEERRLKEEAALNETLAASEVVEDGDKEEHSADSEGVKDTEAGEGLVEEAKDLPDIKEGEVAEEAEDLPDIKEVQAEDLPDIKEGQAEDLPDVQDISEKVEEFEQAHEKPAEQESTEDLSKEELGRLVASRWTGEKTDETGTSTQPDIDDYDKEEEPEIPEHNLPDEEDEDTDSYEYDSHRPADESEKDEEESTWWTKILKASRFIYNTLGLRRMHVDTSEAERIRSDYRQSNSKLSDLQSKISDLEKKLKQDFGKDGEFYSLYDQCFERRQQKYVYKVCFYKDAKQEENHHSTRLGKWDGFKDDLKTILFQNGDHCWNGPERSLTLKLRCGLKSELSDVEEPSRCEYAASFWTPAVCSEEKAKELQAELDALRAGVSVTDHSEL